jgi:DNA-binding CsgD family transcriptional regulator
VVVALTGVTLPLALVLYLLRLLCVFAPSRLCVDPYPYPSKVCTKITDIAAHFLYPILTTSLAWQSESMNQHRSNTLVDQHPQDYMNSGLTLITLSERETLILQGLAEGHTTAETARQLHMSPGAVATARSWLYAKLGAINGPHAVALGFQRGLIRLPRAGPERWGTD